MKNIILSVLAMLLAWGVEAQSVITGTVREGVTGKPLEGAALLVEQTGKGTTTDSTGAFRLESQAGFSGMIRVSFVGYKTQFIHSGQGTISIRLFPEEALREVVISAIRAGETDPVTQKTITLKTIESHFYGEDGAFLLEKMSPSLISYSESGTGVGNYGQMRLRGIDQTRINITLDGAPLNDMVDQGVFFSNFIDFGNSIQSVQIQRGVGASTNGTASYAGSISFESLHITDSVPYAEVQLTGGSFHTYRASAEVYTGKIAKNFSMYTRFSSFKSDGYKYHTSTNSWSFFMGGEYQGTHDRVKLTGFTGRSRNGLGYLPVSIYDIKKDPRTNYVNENDIDNFGQSFLQVRDTHTLPSGTLVTSLYFGSAGGDFPSGYTQTDSIYSASAPGNYYLSNRLVQINYPLFNRHYGFISNYQVTNPSHTFDFSAGIHLYTFHRRNLESILPDNAHPYYDERSVKNEGSLFAKAGYHLENLTVYGDAEFRTLDLIITPDKRFLPDESDIIKNWTFLNPKIGLTYAVGRSQDIYLFGGRSYREPTKIDILGGYELYPSNVADARSGEVKPEQVDDIETGFRIHAERLKASLNFFDMEFHNEIAPIGKLDADNFIQLRKNIPRSYRRGLELDGSFPLAGPLSLGGNFTYMKSRIREYAPTGDPKVYHNVQQALSPDLMGTVALGYHDNRRLEASLSGRFLSRSFLEPTNNPALVIPSFFILTASARLNIYKESSVYFVLDNILNKLYYTNGTPVDINMDGIPEPGYYVQAPRNFYIMLTLHI